MSSQILTTISIDSRKTACIIKLGIVVKGKCIREISVNFDVAYKWWKLICTESSYGSVSNSHVLGTVCFGSFLMILTDKKRCSEGKPILNHVSTSIDSIFKQFQVGRIQNSQINRMPIRLRYSAPKTIDRGQRFYRSRFWFSNCSKGCWYTLCLCASKL